ncbi:FUSC family protein [Granulibacter bethesdensis]|uniref:Fusaric acid resistance protein fusD n=1 Tax=Granulibacter bethesdensis (strain ATCC BAA-1260 / CGDNIH1) TaxID=391165 RepID=Q0BQ71_GRABC|nr:FUSC family protein [Granulibacter bethesdensis]ABI63031.1 Fusaric acid resistance protein fusD [Granulibacter bethesdensis CGDNIH1]APH52903.1 Fusaric acid resistance protein fusD [Granulibacter bethesdensis]APH65591.1 Fusaric acid resistance protein fusD [Granulibacter bethesdensis]
MPVASHTAGQDGFDMGAWLPGFLRSAAFFYALRLALSGSLALYCAYFLQLQNPSSALVTTIIVASPMRGAILSKSLWRFLGTILGCVASIMAVALFVQSPLLYLSAFAVWTGCCSYISNLLRYFRAYSAALAGYTIALIGFGDVLAHPDTIFSVALDRLSVVSLGIVCSALVTMLLQPATSENKLQADSMQSLRDLSELLTMVRDGASEEKILDTRRRLLFRIASYDQAVEFGAAESSEVARRANAFRQLFGLMTSVTASSMRIGERLQALSADPQTAEAAARLRRILSNLIQHIPDNVQELRHLVAASSHMHVELRHFANHTQCLKSLGLVNLLDDAARQLRMMARLADPRVQKIRRVRLPLWRDHVTALRSGLRAFLAAELLGLFWIYTEWPSGGSAIVMTAIIVALAATGDNPSGMMKAFLQGTLIASVLSFVLVYGILVHMDGFPLLLMAYMPIVILCGYMQASGRNPALAMSIMLFYAVLSPIANPIHYNLTGFLNSVFSSIIGALAANIAFMILVPPSFEMSIRLATLSLWRGVSDAARKKMPASNLTWEYPQYQKLMRISARLPPAGPERRRIGRGSAALVLTGREIFKIRHAIEHGIVPVSARPAVQRLLAVLRRQPQRAAEFADHACREVVAAGVHDPQLLRTAASLAELHLLLLEGGRQVSQS